MKRIFKKTLDTLQAGAHRSGFMDTITYRAVLDKTHIGFLNSIIESYEGIAVVRTMDAPSGIIELWIPPAFEHLVNDIISDIAEEIGLQSYYKAQYRLSS